jgi:methyl-accepting chemotaxis protein
MALTTNAPTLQTAEKRTFRPFISLRVKLLVGFTLLFFVVFAVAFAWFYTFASGVAEDRIRADLTNALVATSAGIDGDDFLALYNEAERNEGGYTDDPRFWELATWLNTVHKLDQRSWPYTYVEGDEPAEVVYVASSAAVEDPPWGVQFKDTEITTSGNMQTGLRQPTTFLDRPYEWEGQTWVSGYAPIRNSAGDVVGGLGIDYNFEYVIGVRNSVRDRAVPAFILAYTTLFILIWFVSSWFTRPITAITRVAEKIGEGDYNVDVSAMSESRFPDEMSTLARVFGSMTNKVEKREEQLKERVAELEITLDLSKRDQQVKEIVESDFFMDLQSKAREMRGRKDRRAPDPT